MTELKRREFLKISSGAALGSLFLLDCQSQAKEKKLQKLAGIGVQLYTVRDQMEKDFAGTLENVARIGYKEVEFAGYFGNDPKEVKTMLDDLGLSAPAAHISLDRFQNDLDNLIEASNTVGHTYLICPSLPGDKRDSIDYYKEIAAFFNETGEKCKQAGMRFGYHNHSFEFEPIDGIMPYDFLLKKTEPQYVTMEMDIFWTINAGFEPVDYFKKYPGRFELCHVKDMAADKKMVDVGAGRIDFANIFAYSETAGMKHYVVEHDKPENSLQSITNSYKYLNKLRYEAKS